MTPTATATGIARYRRLLLVPGVLRALVLVTLARLPIGMTSLALLFLVQQERGSFATGGLVSSVYSGALAVAAPGRGRAVDRRGGRSVLLFYGIAHPVALLCVLGAVVLGAPLPVLLVLTAAAGATYPPIGPLARSMWSVLYDDEGDLSTAYALDAVLVEVSFILGPLLVALALTAGNASLAVVLSVASVAAGSLLLAASPVTARIVPHADHASVSLRTPLTSAPVRRLLTALAMLGVGFGATEVGVAAHAVEEGAPQVAGPLLTVWALGSLVGGLFYGARSWKAPVVRQYPWLVAAQAVALLLPLLAFDSISLGALLLVGGAVIAPFSACNSAMLARSAPAATTTATFAWAGSCIVAGSAVGVGVSGWLVEHAGGAFAAFCLGAVAGAVALGSTLAGRRVLTRAGGPV